MANPKNANWKTVQNATWLNNILFSVQKTPLTTVDTVQLKKRETPLPMAKLELAKNKRTVYQQALTDKGSQKMFIKGLVATGLD